MEARSESLRRKKGSSQSEWTLVWNEIRKNPDHARSTRLLDDAAQRTIDRLKQVERAGWAWSGGKDSIGLEAVLEHAGLSGSLQGTLGMTRLEFPEFTEWCDANLPENVSKEVNGRIDLAWLKAKPTMLFPAQNASKWFPLVQKATQRRFAKQHRLEVMIGGWRGQDGNYLGSGDREYEYVTPQGFTKYSPIAQWTHEDLLHVIAHSGKQLPPIYDYPRGFPVGTGPWPSRPRLDSLKESWSEIYGIESSLVHEAAEAGLRSASRFLRNM